MRCSEEGNNALMMMYMAAYMRGYTFLMRGFTSISGGYTFLMRGFMVLVRGYTFLVRGYTFEVSFSTWQNCIFGGMLPKLMANASNTAVVKATFCDHSAVGCDQ